MRETVVSFPRKRLEELKEEERILSKSISDEKRELEILERKHLIVEARIEELESLLKYSAHDDAVLRDLNYKNECSKALKKESKWWNDPNIVGKIRVTDGVKSFVAVNSPPMDTTFSPDLEAGVMKKREVQEK